MIQVNARIVPRRGRDPLLQSRHPAARRARDHRPAAVPGLGRHHLRLGHRAGRLLAVAGDRAGRGLIIGPTDSLQNSVSITGLADGAYSFQVLQVDAPATRPP